MIFNIITLSIIVILVLIVIVFLISLQQFLKSWIIMTNARVEFLEHTADKEPVVCATLIRTIDYDNKVEYNLKVSYTSEELKHFLALISFQYDSGYGSQYLEGTIWYADGSWSTRYEYDGSEWWHHNKLPEIPFKLRTKG